MRKTFSIKKTEARLAECNRLEALRRECAPTHWGVVDQHRASEIAMLQRIVKVHAAARLLPSLRDDAAREIRNLLKQVPYPSCCYE